MEVLVVTVIIASPIFILRISTEIKCILSKRRLKKMYIKEKTTECIDENCVICFERMITKEKKYKLYCDHIYHKKCINKWLCEKVTCPLCNLPIKIKRNGKITRFQ